ncbi:MAG: hypothetical protein B9S32_13850 [Verrucomicrobia bacterium Tous-C9LFEB]|nr:MAG: hypothetical protein B9S32_13850 [Verrucomicrobia bacterium Tous-C9LFEB]
MSRIFDGDFTVAAAVSQRLFEFPFMGDLTSCTFKQTFMIDAEHYAPLPLSTRDTVRNDMFLVAEDGQQNIGGGIITFDRTYATIPLSRNDYEPYAWTAPAFVDANSTLERIAVAWKRMGSLDRISVPGTYAPGMTVTVSQRSANNQVAVTLTTNLEVYGSYSVSRTVEAIGTEGLNGPYIDVANLPWKLSFGNTNIGYPRSTVTLPASNRVEKSLVVSSRCQYDYFLPGVTAGIAQPEDIDIYQRAFFYTTATGAETNSLSSSTSPTVAVYKTWISSRQELIPEPSDISRWMGNIWQRKTRYIKAQ